MRVTNLVGAGARSLALLLVLVAPSAYAAFTATGSMSAARVGHTATLLPNGKVLIAGGSGNSAELYDPSTGTFSAAGAAMTVARSGHTATLLPNGRVLIAGGSFSNTAEVYDPVNDSFTATAGNMSSGRNSHTATLLPNGKLLIAGGLASLSSTLNTAELYDPATRTFDAVSSTMNAMRFSHTATLLSGGRVLIAGGSNNVGSLASAEIYDPASGMTGVFAATGNLNSARSGHTATALSNGMVLVTGGRASILSHLNTADLYEPTAGTFGSTGTMSTPRTNHRATLLPNGKVLITGGESPASINTAELYDAGTFGAVETMTGPRSAHTATLLPAGIVLLAGGLTGSSPVTTAEIYRSSGGTFTATGGPFFTFYRQRHTATLLRSGKVLIAGDQTEGATTNLFDPAGGGTFTFGPTMNAVRWGHTATLLPNGKVLIAGGHTTGNGYLNSAELYDPGGGTSGTFTLITETMTTARDNHTATLLGDGKVLIAGGVTTGTVFLNTAELYDPTAGTNGTFMPIALTMTAPRERHTATLLPDGKVLLAGGSELVRSADVYDAAAGTFTAASGLMSTARFGHTATLLPNGRVLIAGGSKGCCFVDLADLYDPVAGTFSATGNMNVARFEHSATLLPNGNVLIAGGVDASTFAELYDPAVGGFPFGSLANMYTFHARHTATLLLNGKVLIAGLASSAELHDVGLGYADARRPNVSTMTNPLCQPANLSLSGLRFMGDSEGSSGSTNSSPANTPLLRLQRVDSDRFLFASPQSFSGSSYFSATLSNLAAGHYRAAIVSNAIPSVEQIIEVATTPLVGAYNAASVDVSGSIAVTPSSLPAGYNGALYPLRASASSGFTGTLAVRGATGVVSVTSAGPVGTYTITVSSTNSCGSVSSDFSLDVLGAPSSVTAIVGTPQSTTVSTPFASQLKAVVQDSAGHALQNVAVNFTAPNSGPSATFSGGGSALTDAKGVAAITATANSVAGSYNATAVVGTLTATFALTNTPGIATNVLATAASSTSVTVSWTAGAAATMYEIARSSDGIAYTILGTSLSSPFTDSTATANTAYLYKVRASAPGLSPYSAPDLVTMVIYTNPTVAAGSIVAAADFSELRTAVNAVRAMKALGAYAFTDSLAAGVIIKAVHLTQLRTALDEARTALLLPAIVYTNPAITAGASVVSAADVNDLRNGVK